MIKLIIDSNKNLKKAATSKVFVGENEFEEITVSCNRRVLVNNIPDFSASLRVVIGENELSYPLAFSDTDSNTMAATVLIDTRMTRAVAELQFYVKFNSGEKVGMTNAIKIECKPNIESNGDEPYIPPIPLDDHVLKSQTIAGIDQYDAITADELKEALDLDDKMDLAPLNPTAEEISALSTGQLYIDTIKRKGIIKDSLEFYDTVYIDTNYTKVTVLGAGSSLPVYIKFGNAMPRQGDIFIVYDRAFIVADLQGDFLLNAMEIVYKPIGISNIDKRNFPESSGTRQFIENKIGFQYLDGEIIRVKGVLYKVHLTIDTESLAPDGVAYTYTFDKYVTDGYTKTEINAMIGDIETLLSEV